MGTLMYGSGEGSRDEWQRPRSRTGPRAGRPGRRFKAALRFGRGAARGAKKENPQTGGSLKQRARELASSSPANDSQRELKAMAEAWLAGKGKR